MFRFIKAVTPSGQIEDLDVQFYLLQNNCANLNHIGRMHYLVKSFKDCSNEGPNHHPKKKKRERVSERENLERIKIKWVVLKCSQTSMQYTNI